MYFAALQILHKDFPGKWLMILKNETIFLTASPLNIHITQ